MIFLFLLLALAGVSLGSWSLMLIVGIMHNDWWSFIPPMGYETAFLIVLVPFLVSVGIHTLLAMIKEAYS
jgi:hypothetical protein